MAKNEKKKNKVQIWVKKETLEYEKTLRKLQIELLKWQNHLCMQYIYIGYVYYTYIYMI